MSRYIITADGEGYMWDGESPVPDGAKLYDMSEEGGLIEVNPGLATDPNLAYGDPGSLGYQLATQGGMGTYGGFDHAGFTNPDAVASFLEPYIPQGADLTTAIADAWQQQQSQFGRWSGADDPGQTALKILAQVDEPWAQQAAQQIQGTPEFAQSQYAGTAALRYDPDAGTFYGVPGPIAAAAMGAILGPMGFNLNATLGGGVLGGAGTGAISSALMGGDPLMGALTGGVAPGLGELGLPAAYIPAASSLINTAISGGDLSQALMGAAGGTLKYMAQDQSYPSVFDETDAGMAEALANPYLSPNLFDSGPIAPLPDVSVTMVPDEPQQPPVADFPQWASTGDEWGWAGGDNWATPAIPNGYYYNEDWGRVLPFGYTINPATGTPINVAEYDYNEITGDYTPKALPQEQADFPIVQPEQDMTGFKTPDSPVTQAAMGNFTPTTDYLPQDLQDMTGFITPDSPITQSVLGNFTPDPAVTFPAPDTLYTDSPYPQSEIPQSVMDAVMGNFTPDPALQFDAPQTLYTDTIAPDRIAGGVIDLGNSQNTMDTNMAGFFDELLGLGDTDMTGFYTPPEPLPWEGASSDPAAAVLGDANYTAFDPNFSYMTPTAPEQGGIDWTGGGFTTNLGNSGGDMIPTAPPQGMSNDLWKLLKTAYGVMAGGGAAGGGQWQQGATGGMGGGNRPPVQRPTMGQNILGQIKNDPMSAALSAAPLLLAMQQANSQKNDIQPYIQKLNDLQGQFAGNEPAYLKSLTDPYDMQTERGRGDLTQSLSQRGVLGSSFGNADLSNYGFMRDTGRGNLLAQAKTQGIGAQGGLINSALTATNNRNLASNALIGAGLGATGKLFQQPDQSDPFGLRALLGGA